jgi:hypothetical protein
LLKNDIGDPSEDGKNSKTLGHKVVLERSIVGWRAPKITIKSSGLSGQLKIPVGKQKKMLLLSSR